MVHHHPTSDCTASSYLWLYTIILPLMVHHHPTSDGTPSSYLWLYTIILHLIVQHHPTSDGTPSSYLWRYTVILPLMVHRHPTSYGTPSPYLWWYFDFAWFPYSLLNLTSSSKWMHNFYFHFQFASGFEVIGWGQRFLLWTTWKMKKKNFNFFITTKFCQSSNTQKCSSSYF